MKTKRKITPKMAARILVLMNHCHTITSSEKMEIMPVSLKFGGKAIEGIASELSMLLHGFQPRTRAKLPRK